MMTIVVKAIKLFDLIPPQSDATLDKEFEGIITREIKITKGFFKNMVNQV
ncbi:hypothetical protein RVY75_27155 (plasmid) [Bacillus mycoides]|nr:hypothetical protein [Bacillus mycoides]WOA66392.1 hypothetical protein RVY75_27155 [Bacillus mycoides]